LDGFGFFQFFRAVHFVNWGQCCRHLTHQHVSSWIEKVLQLCAVKKLFLQKLFRFKCLLVHLLENIYNLLAFVLLPLLDF
jgi:hypothetical protein